MSEQTSVAERGWQTTSAVLENGPDEQGFIFGANFEPSGDPPELMLWGTETDPAAGWM